MTSSEKKQYSFLCKFCHFLQGKYQGVAIIQMAGHLLTTRNYFSYERYVLIDNISKSTYWYCGNGQRLDIRDVWLDADHATNFNVFYTSRATLSELHVVLCQGASLVCEQQLHLMTAKEIYIVSQGKWENRHGNIC